MIDAAVVVIAAAVVTASVEEVVSADFAFPFVVTVL